MTNEINSYQTSSLAKGATGVRYRVLVLLTLAAAISYLVRNAVSVAESTIRKELELSIAQSAWFMGSFYWSYALCQVPSGWLSQRWGTRAALGLFAVLWSLAALMFKVSPGLWLLVIAQLLMGIAQAGVFPASCSAIASWMPLSRRSISCAVLASGMQVGAILASFLTGSLLASLGWRNLFVLYALPGFVWAGWFWWQYRNSPAADPQVNTAELAIIQQDSDQVLAKTHEPSPAPTRRTAQTSAPWLAMVRNQTLWLLCGQQTARAAGYMFFASWFPTFLQQTRGVSINQSGMLQGLVFAGTLMGSLCGGWITDWIFKRTTNLRLSRSLVGFAALASCGGLILAAWFIEDVTLAVLLMAAGSVCAALAGPCAFSATIDVGGQHVPQVFGTMNMAGNIAAALCPVVVAAIFSWTGNWNLVLLLFAFTYVCGALCWLGIDPREKLGRA